MARLGGEHGFTLVEVLTALSVFSIAALAIINLNNETAAGAGHTDKRFLAEVEASNILSDAMLQTGRLSPGQETGEVTQRGRRLQWTRVILPTEREDLVRIDVTVTDPESGQTLAAAQAMRGAVNAPDR